MFQINQNTGVNFPDEIDVIIYSDFDCEIEHHWLSDAASAILKEKKDVYADDYAEDSFIKLRQASQYWCRKDEVIKRNATYFMCGICSTEHI